MAGSPQSASPRRRPVSTDGRRLLNYKGAGTSGEKGLGLAAGRLTIEDVCARYPPDDAERTRKRSATALTGGKRFVEHSLTGGRPPEEAHDAFVTWASPRTA
jgi:hypothetical protein